MVALREPDSRLPVPGSVANHLAIRRAALYFDWQLDELYVADAGHRSVRRDSSLQQLSLRMTQAEARSFLCHPEQSEGSLVRKRVSRRQRKIGLHIEAICADRDLAELGDARFYRAAAAESFQGHWQSICPVRFVYGAGAIYSRAPSEQILDRDDRESRRGRI